MKYILCQLWAQLFQHISCYTPSAHKLSAGPTIFPQNWNFDFAVFKMEKKKTKSIIAAYFDSDEHQCATFKVSLHLVHI